MSTETLTVTVTAAAPPRRAGRREWAGLAVLVLPLLVLSLDVSILFLAAPELATGLGASATQQLWILDIYGFLIGGFLLTMGTLSDRLGRRRLLLWGGAAFAAASVLAAFAPTAEALIAARALLGVAGATLMPATLGLIRTMFPEPAQRSRAVALWMTTFSGGAALGPVAGGLLLEWFWWGSVFLLGVPLIVALLVLGPLLLPDDRPAGGHRRPLDLAGVVLSLAAMLPLVWAVKETAAHGPGPGPAAALVAGIVAGTAFVRRQRRRDDPMLDLTLFADRGFVAAVALVFLVLLALNGLTFLLPQYLQFVVALGPLDAGFALLPVAASAVVSSLATPRLVARWGRTRTLACGLGVSVVGAAGLGLTGSGAVPAVVVGLAGVTLLGMGPVGVLATDLVIGAAPPERAGAAAAVSETSGELGVALGVAAIGSVVAAVYGPRVDAALATAAVDVHPGMRDAAGDSVADAIGVADATGGVTGAAVRDAAVGAFTDAFAVVGWISAGIAATIVVLVLTALRSRT